jgi:hypothetical protein
MAMRLTLRTMLAHLDGILDPADSEDMAKKIAESEFATSLAHRIGDCTKRLRLPAPKMLGKGTALDPNTVAEYLDSTLPSERMPDFEKVCLESDVHLAEVAACHHILTMVIGQPAHFEPESRRRMYELGGAGGAEDATALAASSSSEVVAAGLSDSTMTGLTDGSGVTEVSLAEVRDAAVRPVDMTVSVPPPAEARATPAPRRKTEVPDYLREGARRQKLSMVMVATAAIGLTVAVLALKDRLLGLFGMGPEVAVVEPNKSDDPNKADDGKNSADETAVNAARKRDAAKAKQSADADAGTGSPTAPTDGKSNGSDRAVQQERVASKDADAASVPPPNVIPAPGDAADKPISDPLPPESPTRGAAKAKEVPAVPPPTPTPTPELPPADAASGDHAPPNKPNVVSPGEAADAAPPAPDKLEMVGRVATVDQVLLRLDPRLGEWQRAVDGGGLASGDRIVALPAFRPKIVLANGLTMELVGDSREGTIVDMAASDASGAPGVRIVHGRLAKIAAAGRQNVAFRLLMGKLAAKVTLADPTTVVAIDVRRIYDLGVDPASVAEPISAEFYVSSGSVDIEPEGGKSATVNEGMRTLWSAAGVADASPIQTAPDWLETSPLEPLDQHASMEFAKSLKPTANVMVVLDEHFHGRRVEEKVLAARSFAYLGRFDALIHAGLKDEKLDWNWREKAIYGLQAAMLRGVESATGVRAALVKEFGERNGAVLYRMAYGYSAAQLKGGGDLRLVENLESDQLALRALAFFNLNVTLGMPSYAYSPERPDNANRKSSVMKWRERAQRGDIVAAAEGNHGRRPAIDGKATAKKPAADKNPATKGPIEQPASLAPKGNASGDGAEPTPPPPAAGADGK